MNFIVPLVFTVLAIGIFAAALHFSRYKQRKNQGCCSGAHLVEEKTDGNAEAKTCCKDAQKSCTC